MPHYPYKSIDHTISLVNFALKSLQSLHRYAIEDGHEDMLSDLILVPKVIK